MKKQQTQRQNYAHPDHLDENELAQYIEYLRSERDQVPEELISHVESCSYCRAEVMAMSDLMDTLPNIEEAPASYPSSKQKSATLRKQPMVIKILRTAAAVAALVMVAWGLKYVLTGDPMNDPTSSNKKHDSMLASKKPSVKKSNNGDAKSATDGQIHTDTILYADAFANNPVYENMIASKYRVSKHMQFVGPETDSIFSPGDPFHLSWKTDLTDQFELLIIDNRERIVYSAYSGSSHELNWKIDLQPGLYYWKLVGNQEVWKVSRFIVRNQ